MSMYLPKWISNPRYCSVRISAFPIRNNYLQLLHVHVHIFMCNYASVLHLEKTKQNSVHVQASIKKSHPSHLLGVKVRVLLTKTSVLWLGTSDSLYSPTTRTSLCTSSRIHFRSSGVMWNEIPCAEYVHNKASNAKIVSLILMS